MAFTEWEYKMIKMNEEYKKQYKVIYKKNGNFENVEKMCKFCSQIYHSSFKYNYRDLYNYCYLNNYDYSIFIPIKTVCSRCRKNGKIVPIRTGYLLSKNY